MKILLTLITLIYFCSSANAIDFSGWKGHFDLPQSKITGFVMRDSLNGQWRGGYDRQIASLSLNGSEVLFAGYNHTWNAEHGNGALGIEVGRHFHVGEIGAFLNLADPGLPPWVHQLDHATSIVGTVAYMPVHSSDVRTTRGALANVPLIYGVGASLDIIDGFKWLWDIGGL